MMQCFKKMGLLEYGKIGLLINLGGNIMVSGIKRLIREMGRESRSTNVELYLRDISKKTNRMEVEDK